MLRKHGPPRYGSIITQIGIENNISAEICCQRKHRVSPPAVQTTQKGHPRVSFFLVPVVGPPSRARMNPAEPSLRLASAVQAAPKKQKPNSCRQLACGFLPTSLPTEKAGLRPAFSVGAGGGTRTHTMSPSTDFESVTSANSITPARVFLKNHHSGNRRAFWRANLKNQRCSVFKSPDI